MDATDRHHVIRKLIDARAPDSSLKDVARGLFAKFMHAGRDCEWPLAPASRLDAATVAGRLGRALGIPVNDVRFVSVSEPYADASWATNEAFDALMADGLQAGLAGSLDRDFGQTFWGRVQLASERRVITGIGETRLEILERDVARKLMPGIRAALFSAFAGPFSVNMVEECVIGVEETLRAFLAFVIMDDRADAVPYGHLARLLLDAMPLGAKRDDPGTWLVATA